MMRESAQNVPTAYPETETAHPHGYAEPSYPVTNQQVITMGLRGVEPRTSRLSGAHVGKSDASVHGESTALAASRPQQRESGTAPKQTSARTHGVPAKATADAATGKRGAVVRCLRLGGGNRGVVR